jgi:hypothetical protein
MCILLATNGLAALCYDPIDQGERFNLFDDKGQPRLGLDQAKPAGFAWVGP